MYQPVRYVLRFMVVVAVTTSVPLLFSPSSAAGAPYLSALSDLTAPSVLATKPATCAPNSYSGVDPWWGSNASGRASKDMVARAPDEFFCPEGPGSTAGPDTNAL